MKDERFWDDGSKKRFCRGCGIDRGGEVKLKEEGRKPTEGRKQEAVSNASKEDKAITTKPLVMCQNCGDQVPHVTHIISIGGRDIDMSICDRCEWLRRAAWQLKLNGMWKPTPRNEPLREVKA